MDKDLKRYLPLATRIFIIVFFITGIYFLSKTILVYLSPFILGWIVASILQPLIRLLTNKLKLPRNISTLLAIFIFVLLTSLILALMGSIIFIQLTKLSNMLPSYSNKFYYQSTYFVKQIQELFVQLPPEISQTLVNGLKALSDTLTSVVAYLISTLLSFLTALPGIFLFIIVTIISAYFMARDRRKILRFILAQFPSKAVVNGKILRKDLFLAFEGYIRAQLILMSITFVESAIGLTLIGIDYSILLAMIASIIDAFPIFGTGMIYTPLILWNLLAGNYQIALFLGILYGVIIIVRQLLEPKILGSQIGLYPLVTLMGMYVGVKIFGFLGLIIGPVCVIILMTLQKIEVLPNFKK